MEDDQNGRVPKWKRTKMEDDQNVRRPKWKTTKMEHDRNGTQPKWNTTKKEDDQNGNVVCPGLHIPLTALKKIGLFWANDEFCCYSNAGELISRKVSGFFYY